MDVSYLLEPQRSADHVNQFLSAFDKKYVMFEIVPILTEVTWKTIKMTTLQTKIQIGINKTKYITPTTITNSN